MKGESKRRHEGLFGLASFVVTALCAIELGPGPAVALQTSIDNPKSETQNPAASPARIDPKGQEILNRAIQALGGENFLKFKTLSTRGRVFAISEGETAGLVPFESFVEYPDKRRFSYGKEKPVVLVNNGEEGWEIDRYGVIRQTAEQMRRWKLSSRYALENLLRLLIHEPRILIQYGGVDFVESVPVQIVDVIDARQVQARVYIHSRTLLPVRISYRVQNPETREWEDYADDYGDYQKVQGIQTPLHITRFMNDERFAETYRNIAVYDKPAPAGYFQPGNPRGVS